MSVHLHPYSPHHEPSIVCDTYNVSRSTALAEYMYIRGRETDFMTHKDPSRKCISKNSASTSHQLLSSLFSQVFVSTIINCFEQE